MDNGLAVNVIGRSKYDLYYSLYLLSVSCVINTLPGNFGEDEDLAINCIHSARLYTYAHYAQLLASNRSEIRCLSPIIIRAIIVYKAKTGL
jgi:hypothetical protein